MLVVSHLDNAFVARNYQKFTKWGEKSLILWLCYRYLTESFWFLGSRMRLKLVKLIVTLNTCNLHLVENRILWLRRATDGIFVLNIHIEGLFHGVLRWWWSPKLARGVKDFEKWGVKFFFWSTVFQKILYITDFSLRNGPIWCFPRIFWNLSRVSSYISFSKIDCILYISWGRGQRGGWNYFWNLGCDNSVLRCVRGGPKTPQFSILAFTCRGGRGEIFHFGVVCSGTL